MSLLGIDPGTVTAGYACLEVAPGRAARGGRSGGAQPLALAASNVIRAQAGPRAVRVVDAGLMKLGRKNAPIEDRLLALSRELTGLLDRLDIDEVALEEAFYGKSVAAALRIGEARGVILAFVRARGLQVRQFAPARIKRAVAGHGTASKDAVARMVCRQLAITDVPPQRDVTDALAVAFCGAEDRGDLLGRA